ncbi:MAG: CHAD domain-containing protein [Burkholderiales bacterium]|jgi:adenylate cyclase
MSEDKLIRLLLPASAHGAFLRHPLLAGARKLGTRKLVDVYFDTPDLALRRHAIALRTRKEGRRWVQTVKHTACDPDKRRTPPKWERPYTGRFDFSDIDDLRVRRLLEWHSVDSPSARIFEIALSRTAWRLTPARKTSLLIMLDRGLVRSGRMLDEISEVVLIPERGQTAAGYELALTLAASLPLRPGILSRLERGYHLRQGTQIEPAKAAASPVHAGQSPRQAFQGVAAACLRQFQLNELGAGLDDPEFIHQMRVALRRLRSALRVFMPVLPAQLVAAAAPQIRTLAATLGRARDRDVLTQEILAPVRSAFPKDARIKTLCDAAEIDRRAARDEARTVLANAEHARFLLSFAAMLDALPRGADDQPIEAFAARRIARLRVKLHALAQEAQNLETEPLHALRIGAKRLRYAIDFFAPLYRSKDVEAAHARLVRLQDTLGTLTDLANAATLLERYAGNDSALSEAVARIDGWHRTRHDAPRAELPGRIGDLLEAKRLALRVRRRLGP